MAGLPKDFQWLRTPEPERIFALADGKLRLFGRESMGSYFEQALVARRQTTVDYYAETEVDFAPYDERCLAGLTAYYGRFNNYYLAVIQQPYQPSGNGCHASSPAWARSRPNTSSRSAAGSRTSASAP